MDGVSFELERFEWTDATRLEVAGRWYGLRGHRFVRPSLTVEAGDDQRRLLADLEHKPWAAEEGEEWVAAFPWDGDVVDIAGAELAVAPTIAIDLPPPRHPDRRRKPPPPTTEPLPAHRPPAEPATPAPEPPAAEPAATAEEPPTPESPAPDRVAEAAVVRLEAELADARTTIRRLRVELDDARGAGVDRDAVVRERDEAVAARAAAMQERDEALDAKATAIWERDAALAERTRAVHDRESVLAEPPPPTPRAAPVRRTALSAQSTRPARRPMLWGARFTAVLVLIVLAAAVYALLHSVL
jgi:hypothetical protein